MRMVYGCEEQVGGAREDGGEIVFTSSDLIVACGVGVFCVVDCCKEIHNNIVAVAVVVVVVVLVCDDHQVRSYRDFLVCLFFVTCFCSTALTAGVHLTYVLTSCWQAGVNGV